MWEWQHVFKVAELNSGNKKESALKVKGCDRQ